LTHIPPKIIDSITSFIILSLEPNVSFQEPYRKNGGESNKPSQQGWNQLDKKWAEGH
jgi:hypothetical protein